MTALQRAEAERDAQDSFSRLLAGWSGVLMTGEVSSAIRARACKASDAARKALSAGATPAEVVRQHIATVFEVEVPPTGC